ncbi:DUF7548 family protein [Halobellus litoreus]|jgi:hypothetical protein|uniref:SPW repeat-containing protein n=1 Tax=Halobellus litoreus TaxID=755310 RepID=A0ABD6DV74_9EURY|nr:hypothetical protein [Halobellus litoreus]
MNVDLDAVAPRLGAIVCLLLAGVVFAPALLISVPGAGVADYYASGPIGVSIVGVLALLNVVVFLAAAQERSDPATLAGVALVSALAMVLFSLVWALSIDPTLLFSFPSEYAWIENHRWIVVTGSAFVAIAAGSFARSRVA